MRTATLTLLAVATAACRPAPVMEPAPAEWQAATAIPDRPEDPADPMARMVWMMQYDNRDFDATWAFLNDVATPGPDRDVALGAAAFLGVFELSRVDVLDAGVAAFDRAIEARPEDARLPLWRAMLLWKAAYLDGDEAAIASAYDLLRETGEPYAGFTLFGMTMSVAADREATPELISEGVAAYQTIFDRTLGYQVGDGGWRAERLGDWEHAPYNQPGTGVMYGDLLLMDGDVEAAEDAYWQALNTNLAYKWPFRDVALEQFDRLDSRRDGLSGQPSTDVPFGAAWLGARGADDTAELPGFGGRIGNGTCTVCHTGLSAYDADTVAAREMGYVRFRYEKPAEIDTPFPVFLGLDGPEPEEPPAGLTVGQLQVGDRSIDNGDGTFTAVLPLEPGRWFVVGEIDTGPENGLVLTTYMRNGIGAPRYLDVEAGMITDFTDGPALRWTVE